jgi:hypothetical protein
VHVDPNLDQPSSFVYPLKFSVHVVECRVLAAHSTTHDHLQQQCGGFLAAGRSREFFRSDQLVDDVFKEFLTSASMLQGIRSTVGVFFEGGEVFLAGLDGRTDVAIPGRIALL